ncbi:MAG: hypothetical protein GW856_15760, partial [Cyanobacteria bacterium]|nr:hypothetical protein [Cyanobacteria bacterium CG_2015-16_32_12]
LGLSPETVKSLKDNDISPPTLKVFQGLCKKATKLTGIRERIQRKYMVYAQPYWFIRECDITKTVEELNELLETCETLRNEALAEYELEKDAYLLKLKNVCESAGLLGDELEKAMNYYASFFPSKEKVASDFRVEISQFVRVPSIKEQAENDAVLAQSQNKLTEANIMQQLNTEYAYEIRRKFSEAVGEAKDEIYGILAEQLGKLETIGTEEINNRTQNSLNKAIERMSVLTGFDEGLQAVAQQFGAIVSTAKNVDQRSQMFNIIGDFRKKLTDEISIISSEGKGHKALAQWML